VDGPILNANEPAKQPPFPSAVAGHDRSWRAALIVVTLAATAVVAPMPIRGNVSGHDFRFHVASWMDAAGQWREGIVYPRWAEWANWGFGEPRFVFYPPASWMIGAALGSVLPWRIVPGMFIWLALIAAGTTMWKLAREWLPGREATAAAVLYAANPYNLVIVYYRSDFAELLAWAILPVILWAALYKTRDEWRRVPLLAVAFAAIWLVDAPAGVIAAYSLVVVVAVASIARRTLRPAMAGAAAMTAGFGLAAFYILPAAGERRWVQIIRAVSGDLRPSVNFLFAQSDNPDVVLFNAKVSRVGLAMIFAAGIAVILSRRVRRELSPAYWALVILAVASVLLMLPLSMPVWRHLPELQYVQFPWRWMAPLAVFCAFCMAAGMNGSRRKWRVWMILAIALAAIGAAAAAMAKEAWWDSEDVPALAAAIRSGQGYEGTNEYMPLGCDRTDLPGNPDDTERPENVSAAPAPRVEKLDPASGEIVPATGVGLHIKRWSAERKEFSYEAKAPVTLTLRLLNYPAWQIRVDGNAARAESAPDTAQLLLPLTAGHHDVHIRFRRTWDRTTGAAISMIFAGALLVFAAWQRRRDISERAKGDGA
jgi:hypothetical protein